MRVITPHSGEFLIRDEGLDTVKEFTKLLRGMAPIRKGLQHLKGCRVFRRKGARASADPVESFPGECTALAT